MDISTMFIYKCYNKVEFMHRVILIILILTLILGCENNPKPTEVNKISKQKTEIHETNEIDSDFDLNNYIHAIDSIFKLQKNKFYNLTIINFRDEGRIGVLAFNQDGLIKVHRYGLFWILEFETPDKSKSSFDEIARLFKKGLNGGNLYKSTTNEGFRIMYDVISKGGASFTLKDNFIIQKLGSCSGSFEELVLNEEKMLDYIFRDEKPDSNYYFRYCCACSREYRMEYK